MARVTSRMRMSGKYMSRLLNTGLYKETGRGNVGGWLVTGVSPHSCTVKQKKMPRKGVLPIGPPDNLDLSSQKPQPAGR